MAETPSSPHFFNSKASSFTSFGFFAVLSVILITVDHKIQLMDPVRNLLTEFSQGTYEVLTSPVRGVDSLLQNLRSKARLETENRQLRDENRKATLDAMRHEELVRENETLRQLLKAKETLPTESRLFDVRNILSDGFTQFYVINGGSDDGIKVGMPVVADTGLAGQVSRVSRKTSMVQLIQDKDLTIPVIFEGSNILGLVQGAGDGVNLVTRDLRYSDKIKVGDHVMTSGLDGIYPRGIPVGVVRATRPSKNGIFSEITIHNPSVIEKNSAVLVLFVDPEKEFELENEESEVKGDTQQRRRAPRR